VHVLRQSVIASGACQKVSARALTHTTRAIDYLDLLPASAARSLLRAVAQQLAERSR
jgi:geranylgeranyl pyrophosphate synthase